MNKTKRMLADKVNPLVIVSMIVLFSCAPGPTSRPATQTILPTCIGPFNERTRADCEYLANQGDAEAAYKLARYHENILHQDMDRAIYWYMRAADLGHSGAMLYLFNSYYYGTYTPKNRRKADDYLQKAIEAGSEWAMLIVAKRLEETEPRRAIDIYRRIARNNNCFAQARLANAYYNGDITELNLAQAYFWLLLAKTAVVTRNSEYHNLAGLLRRGTHCLSGTKVCSCSGVIVELWKIEGELESTLPPKYISLVQDAATNWRKGQQEPSLPAPSGTWTRIKEKPRPTKELPESYAAQLPKWIPLSLSVKKPPMRDPRDITKLFQEISRSVWLVFAAQSAKDLERGKGAIGSAVAVTRTQLLTNCHVIETRPIVWLNKGDQIERAEVTAADRNTDRCILTIDKEILEPVKGIRAYSDLKQGEQVYTIGSPSGLENTLGQGIISGLRRLDRLHLIQTTAQISSGSSGGGLFDHFGNLIGVTTFMIINAQGLNFAIAAEDYFR